MHKSRILIGAGLVLVLALSIPILRPVIQAVSDGAVDEVVTNAADDWGADSGRDQRCISEERIQMLVEKDFWTHRLQGTPRRAGGLWVFETPYCNCLALGDFLNYTVIMYNSSEKPIEVNYSINMRKYETKTPEKEDILKSYNDCIELQPFESYCLYPIFFFDESKHYWLETVINGSYTGYGITVFADYEYGG